MGDFVMRKRTLVRCEKGHTFEHGGAVSNWCPDCNRAVPTVFVGTFDENVYVFGNVSIGRGTNICGHADINGTGSSIEIGEDCDIAGNSVINCADSSNRCLGLAEDIARSPIKLEHHVYVGAGCIIKGGAVVGHHSKVAAGVVVDPGYYPPYSLVYQSYEWFTTREYDKYGKGEDVDRLRPVTRYRRDYYLKRCEDVEAKRAEDAKRKAEALEGREREMGKR